LDGKPDIGFRTAFLLDTDTMGCTSSKVDPEDKEAVRTNANIDKQIRTDKKKYDRTVKILLLGMFCVSRGGRGGDADK
jgi:hypothetical protein